MRIMLGWGESGPFREDKFVQEIFGFCMAFMYTWVNFACIKKSLSSVICVGIARFLYKTKDSDLKARYV